jgi:hypothetical protein
MQFILWPFNVLYRLLRFTVALIQLLPHTKALWRHWRGSKRMDFEREAERRDRILNPAKYFGQE